MAIMIVATMIMAIMMMGACGGLPGAGDGLSTADAAGPWLRKRSANASVAMSAIASMLQLVS